MLVTSKLDNDHAPSLFKSGCIEDIERIPDRPLGAFSDFIIEELPVELDKTVKSSPREAETILTALSSSMDDLLKIGLLPDRLEEFSNDKLTVTRVDAVYAYNGFVQAACIANLDPCYVHNNIIPQSLHRLVKSTSRLCSSLPLLTYEDMILFNPIERDPRVYTRGQTGLAERDFCNGHKYIESHLQVVIDTIEQGLNGTATELKTALEQAIPNLQACCDIMRVFYSTMQMDDFVTYRNFFGKNPVHGTLGPSGRFSARTMHLTILFIGDIIYSEKPEFYRSLFELRDLFPGEGMARIVKRLPRAFCPDVFPDLNRDLDRKRYGTMLQQTLAPPTVWQAVVAHGKPGPLLDTFSYCKNLLDIFTSFHIAAAYKYTVGPQRPTVGVNDTETIDNVLRQRYRLGTRIHLQRHLSLTLG